MHTVYSFDLDAIIEALQAEKFNIIRTIFGIVNPQKTPVNSCHGVQDNQSLFAIFSINLNCICLCRCCGSVGVPDVIIPDPVSA